MPWPRVRPYLKSGRFPGMSKGIGREESPCCSPHEAVSMWPCNCTRQATWHGSHEEMKPVPWRKLEMQRESEPNCNQVLSSRPWSAALPSFNEAWAFPYLKGTWVSITCLFEIPWIPILWLEIMKLNRIDYVLTGIQGHKKKKIDVSSLKLHSL